MRWILSFLFLFFIILVIFFASKKNLSTRKKLYYCKTCHYSVFLDKKHQKLKCIDCHKGKSPAPDKKIAHFNLEKIPSSETIIGVCNNCHKREVLFFKNSLHFTYKKELTSIFRAFGIKKVMTLEKLKNENPKNEFIDFLRRRCLLCHIEYEGDYPATRRAKGCLACHFSYNYENGSLINHFIKLPSIYNCLACHHSIYIGWDYLGYFPHNWYWDYRSPFINGKEPKRPFGIEYYQLKPSIHFKKGLVCTDCHKKEEIMFSQKKVKCISCHKNFKNKTIHNSKIFKKFRCEVCHFNFVSQDRIMECFLVNDVDELEDWIELAVQESLEIENILNDVYQNRSVKLVMRDKLTNEERKGVWLCKLSGRTFEKFTLGKDQKGRLCVLRKGKLKIEGKIFKKEAYFQKCVVPHSIGIGTILIF